MDQFTPQTIGSLLLVIGALYVAVRGFKSYCDRVDAEWAAKNPPVPDQQEIAAEHCEKVGAKLRNSEQCKNVRYLRDWETVRRHDAETERRLMAHIHGMHQGDKP